MFPKLKIRRLAVQVWLGYKQSLRPCENGLTLNIDVAATAFLSPDPVLKFLSNTLRRPEEALTLDNREDLRKAEKALRSLKVSNESAHIRLPKMTVQPFQDPLLYKITFLSQESSNEGEKLDSSSKGI